MTKIRSGQVVDPDDLLAENLKAPKSEPESNLDGPPDSPVCEEKSGYLRTIIIIIAFRLRYYPSSINLKS